MVTLWKCHFASFLHQFYKAFPFDLKFVQRNLNMVQLNKKVLPFYPQLFLRKRSIVCDSNTRGTFVQEVCNLPPSASWLPTQCVRGDKPLWLCPIKLVPYRPSIVCILWKECYPQRFAFLPRTYNPGLGQMGFFFKARRIENHSHNNPSKASIAQPWKRSL